MIKELKKKGIIKSIITGIIMLAISIIIMLLVFGNLFAYLKPAVDINEISADDLKQDLHVKGSIYFVADYYAYLSEGNKTKEMEFIIPVGDEEYMGFVCRGSKMKDAEFNMNMWWDYLDYDKEFSADSLIEIKINGIVKILKGESYQYYREFTEDLDKETADLFVPYAVYVGLMAGQESSDSAYSLIFIVIFAVAGLAFLIFGTHGHNVKAVTDYCKETLSPEYTLQKIENFYTSGTPVQGLRANDEYFMGVFGSTVFFAESSDILWAYQTTTQHRTNGIPTGKTYSVRIRKADGKDIQFKLKNEAACQEALAYIGKTMPYVILGYDDSLENMYNKNRSEMINTVAQRREQYAGSSFESAQ